MLTVQPVPLAYVQQTWPLVEQFLEAAMDKQTGIPQYTLDNVRAYIASGEWLLLVAVEDDLIKGAMTVTFYNTPLHRVAFITALGGKLVSTPEALAQLKEIVRQHGASILQAYGRDEMVRLLQRHNFTKANTLVETLL
jgi:hypothetical protein